MTEKKVLLLVPSRSARGGITNYYYSLKGHFPTYYEYFERGARNWPYRSGVLAETKRIIIDLFSFILKLASRRYCLVQSNTSLGLMSVFRDGLFLAFARLFGIKTIVFFRGWNPKIEVEFTGWRQMAFKIAFFSCDHVIVLSSSVEGCIRDWGYKGEITRETTLVDNLLLKDLDDKSVLKNYPSGVRELLFLGRIECTKGVFELLYAFKVLSSRYHDLKLVFAGDGRDEANLGAAVDELGLNTKVAFLGFVEGLEKQKAFLDADIYVFPSYSEGMPNSLLEAMAFGLPVFTRPVGGIPDVVIDGKNGILEESLDPAIIANRLGEMISNINMLKSMSKANYDLAQSQFLASGVASRLMSIHCHVLNK